MKKPRCTHVYATVTNEDPRHCVKCGGYVTSGHFRRSGYIGVVTDKAAKNG